jgi:hypothetical protein
MSTVGGPRLSTIPTFTNTYSLDFDGVDDYLNLGRITAMEGATNFSFSMWVYPTSYTGVRRLFGKIASATDFFQANTTNEFGYIQWYIADGQTNYPKVQTSSRIDLNNWGLLTFVYDGSLSGNLNKAKIYINGTLASNTTTAYQMPSSISLDTTDFYVAQRGGNPSTPTAGNIDEVSAYDYSLSASEVMDIYNGGVPTDLSLLATPPLHWYRMGDNGSWKSPQWLIPNNENKDKVSNYSMDFDGVDDYFDLTSSVDLGINNTISAWVKRSDILNLDSITGESSYSNGVGIYISSNQRVYMKIGAFITFWYNVSGFGILNQVDTWFHLAIVRQGNDATLYLNGSPTFVKSGWGTSITTKFDRIGAYALTGGSPMFGNLDEIAGFDSALTDLQINDIYNGGTPTTISGAVAHYKMGEEATFSGGVWTVPDAVGSNNGTSNGMTIEDRVGEAPNSKNNAVSYNMDLIDRVEDTPSTT